MHILQEWRQSQWLCKLNKIILLSTPYSCEVKIGLNVFAELVSDKKSSIYKYLAVDILKPEEVLIKRQTNKNSFQLQSCLGLVLIASQWTVTKYVKYLVLKVSKFICFKKQDALPPIIIRIKEFCQNHSITSCLYL